MTTFDARVRLRLLTKRTRQIKPIADARAKPLRVVDALRTTIVTLSVVRKDRRDGIEWTVDFKIEETLLVFHLLVRDSVEGWNQSEATHVCVARVTLVE